VSCSGYIGEAINLLPRTGIRTPDLPARSLFATQTTVPQLKLCGNISLNISKHYTNTCTSY
jgi:hypothetical protein